MNEFQPRSRNVWSRNQSCCLYTHLAVVQDHDPAAAHHGVQTVGDDEGGAAAKRTANGLLDEAICLSVDGCCGFVQYKNLREKSKCYRYNNTKLAAKQETSKCSIINKKWGNTSHYKPYDARMPNPCWWAGVQMHTTRWQCYPMQGQIHTDYSVILEVLFSFSLKLRRISDLSCYHHHARQRSTCHVN